MLRPKFRTWAQFRGYAQVETRTGNDNVNGTPDKWTSTKFLYYRGMDGDRLPNGEHRDVDVTDSEGSVRPDRDTFAGQLMEIQQFDGVGGALVAKTINVPTIVATTATRDRGSDLDPVKAQMVRPSSATTYTAKAAGGHLTAGTTTKYDSAGRAIEVTSTASGALTSCVQTTYGDNDTTGVRNKASEVITYENTCPTAATPTPPVRRAVRTYYDGSATLGTKPHVGRRRGVDRPAPWVALGPRKDEKRPLTLEDVGRRFRRSGAVSGHLSGAEAHAD